MGIAQGGGGLVGIGKLRQVADHLQQLSPEVFQTVPVQDNVGVVGDIAAGGSQMDDAGGGGGCLSIGVDMGHHIVAHFFFPLGGAVKIDVGDMLLKLLYLLGCDGQTQLHLCFGKGYPQPSPGFNPLLGGEQVQHILRCVTGAEGGFVLFRHGFLLIE